MPLLDKGFVARRVSVLLLSVIITVFLFLLILQTNTALAYKARNLPQSSSSLQTGPDAYEPDNTCQLARLVTTNGITESHTLHSKTDVDWFHFVGNGGTRSGFTVEINGDFSLMAGIISSDCSFTFTYFDIQAVGGRFHRVVGDRVGEHFLKLSVPASAPNNETTYTIFFELEAAETPTVTPTANPSPTRTATMPATNTPRPTATPTNTPSRTATHTVTPMPTTTPPSVPTPTSTASPSSTPTPTTLPSGVEGATLYMPLVLRPLPTNTLLPTNTPLPQPLWQRVGQAGLNVSAIAIHNGQLFVGERKENGRPGGLYQRPLNSCQLTPDLTRMDVINNSSVLGLAFQGTQGVAATFDTNLFYSNDNGSSWNQSTTSVTNPRTVAIAGGSVFYAGTEASGIYESTNGGVSWQQLEPDPPAINRVLLDTGTLWIGAQTGVFKRTLGGMTEITAGLHSESSKQVWDFAFRAANEIYIATFDGVYRGDGANAWQSFGLQGKELYTVEFKDDMLYAGVQRGGVWRRAISGSDWVAVTSPGWNSATTVRDLLYDTTTCNGLLAATGDGVWFYR